MLVLTLKKKKKTVLFFISLSVKDPDKGRGRNNHSSAIYFFLIKINEKRIFFLHSSYITRVVNNKRIIYTDEIKLITFCPSVDFRLCVQVRNKTEKCSLIVKLNFYPVCVSSIELDTAINLVFLLYFISVS